jgi:hypothetical protein
MAANPVCAPIGRGCRPTFTAQWLLRFPDRALETLDAGLALCEVLVASIVHVVRLA